MVEVRRKLVLDVAKKGFEQLCSAYRQYYSGGPERHACKKSSRPSEPLVLGLEQANKWDIGVAFEGLICSQMQSIIYSPGKNHTYLDTAA